MKQSQSRAEAVSADSDRESCSTSVWLLVRIHSNNIPLLHAINTKIDPPDAGDTQHRPEEGLLTKGADRKPCEDQEVGDGNRNQEEDAHNKEEGVEGKSISCGLCWDGKERRNARACQQIST